jgi:uncharacterized protein YbjT (DUF2867 family)
MGTAYGGRGALVIGATGTVGRHVVEGLGQTGARVRAMTRSPDTARVPSGVEVVQGDLTVPETLDRCVDGVDAVFLVWTAPQSTSDAALERIAKRARRIVFLSAPLKTPHPFFQQPNPARTLGLHLEALIERSGVEWTMLRPGMFAANAREFWGPQVRGGDVVRWPYLEAPTAPIDERDIAAVAVRALTETGHGGKDYVITGPQSLTQYEQIATIGRVLGRELCVVEMTPDDARREVGDAACGGRQYAARRLGRRPGTTCVRDFDRRGGHGIAATYFSPMDHRQRGSVPVEALRTGLDATCCKTLAPGMRIGGASRATEDIC